MRSDISELAISREWTERASCREADPELFFPITTTGPAVDQVTRAKAVCDGCAVTIECLEYALVTGQGYGVWGGTTPEERRSIRATSRDVRRASRQFLMDGLPHL